jgi:hypothetical protein
LDKGIQDTAIETLATAIAASSTISELNLAGTGIWRALVSLNISENETALKQVQGRRPGSNVTRWYPGE